MVNAFINWVPFDGYFIILDGQRFHITNGRLIFYNEKGETCEVDLQYGCRFLIKFNDINFAIRKKVDFTRNEVFAIKTPKRSKYDKNANAIVYIPMSAVNLEFGTPHEIKDDCFVKVKNSVTFNVEHFHSFGDQSHPDIIVDNDNGRATFNIYLSTEFSKEYKELLDLTEEINKTCGCNISTYDLSKIFKHYNITKR